MSIHSVCFQEGQSGNCGTNCRGFIHGDCSITNEICDHAFEAGCCGDGCSNFDGDIICSNVYLEDKTTKDLEEKLGLTWIQAVKLKVENFKLQEA